MPKIKIDNQEIELVARPYSITLYSREFGDDRDLVEDAMTLVQGFQKGKIKANLYMGIIWCFAKTHSMMNKGSVFPGYEDWMMGFDSINLSNDEDQMALVELINGSLFREEKKDEKTE